MKKKLKNYTQFFGRLSPYKKLSVEDLRRVAEELGMELAENEIEEMTKSVNLEEIIIFLLINFLG